MGTRLLTTAVRAAVKGGVVTPTGPCGSVRSKLYAWGEKQAVLGAIRGEPGMREVQHHLVVHF